MAAELTGHALAFLIAARRLARGRGTARAGDRLGEDAAPLGGGPGGVGQADREIRLGPVGEDDGVELGEIFPAVP